MSLQTLIALKVTFLILLFLHDHDNNSKLSKIYRKEYIFILLLNMNNIMLPKCELHRI